MVQGARAIALLLLLLVATPVGAESEPASGPNQLTSAEAAEGWRLLFNGTDFDGWRMYGADGDAVAHWVVEDGALKFTREVSELGLVWQLVNPFGDGVADLVTKERFDHFELRIEWKISPGGNSGIFYLIPHEDSFLPWDLALEMQVLDDDGHRDGQLEKRRAGDLYDIQSLREPPGAPVTRPVGEWNQAHICKSGERIVHWLNGHKVVDLRRGSSEWDAMIAQSKFADVEGFGLADDGHISLQDHGDVVWYRSIALRELRADDAGARPPCSEPQVPEGPGLRTSSAPR